jgi:hypothetical protein
MAKYLIIGDIHATEANRHKVEKLFGMIESLGRPTIFLGDQLDKRGYVEISCLNMFFNYFQYSKLQHILMVGNHCLSTQDSNGNHSMEVFKALKSITVVDKPLRQGKVLFVPFQRNLDDFRRIIKDSDAEVLFFHNGVNGFDYGTGLVADRELPIEDLKQFKRAIGGHFHKFQTRDNLTYLGSPFSHNFGESNQDKYLGIFDTDTGTMELIKTDFPRHITTTLDLNVNVNLQLDHYDHNRVILKGTREQIELFDKSAYPEVKFLQEQVEDSFVPLKETQSPEQLFQKWFTDIKKETNPDILKLGLDILKDVK